MIVHIEVPAAGEQPARVAKLAVEDKESAAVLRGLVARGNERIVVPAATGIEEVLALFGAA